MKKFEKEIIGINLFIIAILILLSLVSYSVRGENLMGEIGNFIADTTKLEKLFGQVPNTTVKSGLEKTISWLRNQ